MAINQTAMFMSNSSKTVANTSTETSLLPSGTLNTDYFGSRTIPAGQLFPGKFFIVKGGGIFSTLLVPGTFTLKVKLGSTVLATVALTNILSSASNNAFQFECQISCRTWGTTGTVVIDGHADYATTATARGFADFTNSGTTITINTTVDQIIDVTGTWTTASSSNTITTTTASISQLSFN